MEASEKTLEKLFAQYEPMANTYAARVFDYNQLGFEFEDLVQELRIKIYTSIKSYLSRLADYNAGRIKKKPVPMKYYIQTALSNKVRDFIKSIISENFKQSIDDLGYDYGICQESSISPEDNEFIVNGVDLLENLHGKQRAIFSLYLRGYNNILLNKVNRSAKKNNELSATEVVRIQREYLIKEYGADLLQAQRVYETYAIVE